MKVMRVVLFIPALTLPLSAYAAGSGGGHPTVLQVVNHLFGSIDATAFKMADALLAYTFGPSAWAKPTSLFVAVVVLMLTVYGYQMVIGASKMNPLGGIIRFLMMMLIVAITLGHYKSFMTVFFHGFDYIAELLLNSMGARLPDASPSSLFGGGLEQLFTLLGTMAQNFPAFNMKGGVLHFIFGGDIGLIVVYALQVVFYLIPFMAVIIATVVYAGMVVFALVYQGIGIVFGPFMLVLLLIPAFESIAYGWLKFCFSAGFLKVVLATLIGLLSGTMRYAIIYTQSINGVPPSGKITSSSAMRFLEVDFLGLTVVTVIAGSFILALLSAPFLANSLLSGSIRGVNLEFGSHLENIGSTVRGAAGGAAKAAAHKIHNSLSSSSKSSSEEGGASSGGGGEGASSPQSQPGESD